MTAAAESGKANAAVIATLAAALKLAKSDIEILSGGSSPRKIVNINLSEAELKERLAAHMTA